MDRPGWFAFSVVNDWRRPFAASVSVATVRPGARSRTCAAAHQGRNCGIGLDVLDQRVERRRRCIRRSPSGRCRFMGESGAAMSIVENRKAFHDYFVEERYEAGLVLEGWEVKAIRAGRAQISDAYVIVARRRALADRRAHQPAAAASTHVKPDPMRTRKLLHARRGDPAADRQGRAARLHAGAARPAFLERPHQTADRACQGQAQAR